MSFVLRPFRPLIKAYGPQWADEQLFASLEAPTASFAGKTVIVTGANVGLGLENARAIARSGVNRLIITARDIKKGEAAREDIISSLGGSPKTSPASIEVWELNLSESASVQAFAARAIKELDRLDVLMENAGVANGEWRMSEGFEATVKVNVLSTFLLAGLLLPKMRASAAAHPSDAPPHLCIVSSNVHFGTSFPQKSAPEGGIFDLINDKDRNEMSDRYNVSKLLEVLAVREMAKRRPNDAVVVNLINPGLCHSKLSREAPFMLEVIKFFLARSTEYGARTLFHAAHAGKESHGQYLSSCKVADPAPLVLSDEGKVAQRRVFDELVQRLNDISPGAGSNL